MVHLKFRNWMSCSLLIGTSNPTIINSQCLSCTHIEKIWTWYLPCTRRHEIHRRTCSKPGLKRVGIADKYNPLSESTVEIKISRGSYMDMWTGDVRTLPSYSWLRYDREFLGPNLTRKGLCNDPTILNRITNIKIWFWNFACGI